VICGGLFLPGILASEGQLVSASLEDYHDLRVIKRSRSEVGDPKNRWTSAATAVRSGTSFAASFGGVGFVRVEVPI
jgi:hypothetical protein